MQQEMNQPLMDKTDDVTEMVHATGEELYVWVSSTLNLTHHFLVANPIIEDGFFEQSVVYIYEHTEDNISGFIINKPTLMDVESIFSSVDRKYIQEKLRKQPLFFGGPIQFDKGFVLHEPMFIHPDNRGVEPKNSINLVNGHCIDLTQEPRWDQSGKLDKNESLQLEESESKLLKGDEFFKSVYTDTIDIKLALDKFHISKTVSDLNLIQKTSLQENGNKIEQKLAKKDKTVDWFIEDIVKALHKEQTPESGVPKKLSKREEGSFHGYMQENGSKDIACLLQMTTSRDILDALACGAGPKRVWIALGYSAWSNEQLQKELRANDWFPVPADLSLIFDVPIEDRYGKALELVGITQKMDLIPQAGLA